MSALRKHRIDDLSSDPETAPTVDPGLDPSGQPLAVPSTGDVELVGNLAGTEYVTRGARSLRSARPHLRMVSPLRPERASRGVFVMVVTGVLVIGMVAILLINTSLAQGAFTISELKAEQTALLEQEQSLAESVEALAAPESLEQQARAMGMVPSKNAAFLDVETGKVLGRPKPAPGTRATMPRLLTPADTTAAEGVDSVRAGLPVSADPALDPAAVDAAAVQAAANELASAEIVRTADPLAENSLWEEAVIMDVTDMVATGNGGGKPGRGGKKAGDEAARGNGAKGDAAKGNGAKGEAAKGEAAKGEAAKGEAAKGASDAATGDEGLMAVPVP